MMATRPQQKPQSEPSQPGLKVVEKSAEVAPSIGQAKPAAKGDMAANQPQSQAAARRRLHPPRIWPD